MKPKTSKLTLEQVRDALSYDPLTGVLTRRHTIRRSGYCWEAGEVAGCVNKGNRGYVCVSLYGEQQLAHRLIWFYVHGVWPPDMIDHVNGNPTDNRIANLRLATRQENYRNKKGGRTKSGYKGVRFNRASKRNPWVAVITIDYKSHHLGVFPTPELAHAAYVAAAKKHFREFARAA